MVQGGGVHRANPEPQSAATLAQLRAALDEGQRLAGYDTIIDVLSDSLTGRSPMLCIQGSRRLGEDLVPSVLAVLDDVICEAWLDGRRVHLASAARPGAPGP